MPKRFASAAQRQLSLVNGANSQPGEAAGPTEQDVANGFDPARLTQARHLAGLTKKALAESVSVTPAAVGQYETGATRPRADLLPALADALGVRIDFFLAGRPHARLGTSTAHFRSLRSMRSYQRDKAIAVVEQMWELAHELERYVQMPPVRLPDWDEQADLQWGAAPSEPAAAARWLRKYWQLGDEPVSHLVRRLEANGIVVAMPADPDATTVDAFSTSALPRPLVVLTANRADDVCRHRFTAAHELAHLLLHNDTAGSDFVREREADQFAAEFLTPRDSLLPLLPRRLDLRRLAELSRTWGVSVHSLLYRCRETGLLSDSAASRGYQRLHSLTEKPGFAAEPVAGFPYEQPLMLRKAFDLANTSGLTLDTLAGRLGWKADHLRVLLNMSAPSADPKPRLELLDEPGASPHDVTDTESDNSLVVDDTAARGVESR